MPSAGAPPYLPNGTLSRALRAALLGQPAFATSPARCQQIKIGHGMKGANSTSVPLFKIPLLSFSTWAFELGHLLIPFIFEAGAETFEQIGPGSGDEMSDFFTHCSIRPFCKEHPLSSLLLDRLHKDYTDDQTVRMNPRHQQSFYDPLRPPHSIPYQRFPPIQSHP